MGILFDTQLICKYNHHVHTTNIAAKAKRLLGLMKRSFDHLDSDMLIKLYCPTLEWCNSTFTLDQRKIEKVQGRATRLLPTISDELYEERLSMLQLPSLTHRCHRRDMILLYKILSNHLILTSLHYSYAYSTTTTRAHQFKLFKYQSRLNCRSNYFLIG